MQGFIEYCKTIIFETMATATYSRYSRYREARCSQSNGTTTDAHLAVRPLHGSSKDRPKGT